MTPLLLVAAIAAVGVLHTLVPDHWMPIVLLARQHGWSRRDTVQAALRAGTGHVLSTLVIALVVWAAGAVAARHLGHIVDTVASLALVGFGGWIVLSAWRELAAAGHTANHAGGHGRLAHAHPHGHGHGHGHAHPHGSQSHAAALAMGHAHLHRHGDGAPHVHWHEHAAATAHEVAADRDGTPPWHDHAHKVGGRGALLLILGSSPMVEGIPVFFAASDYGVGVLALMAAAFAAGTIATYVALCAYATARLQQVQLGGVERYGEVLSGALIVAIGLAFWFWPIA